LIKYIKYLILLFLAFILTVNDCTLDSQSNSVDYYQSSNVILRSELNYKGSKSYTFGQVNSLEKTLFPIPLTYLMFQDIYNLQIRVLQKSQTLLYQKVSSITTQYIFINELITSKNIYIA
jgi:hypothetical protein